MTFIFKNMTIFWDILKQNRGQTKWDGGSIYFFSLFISISLSSPSLQPTATHDTTITTTKLKITTNDLNPQQWLELQPKPTTNLNHIYKPQTQTHRRRQLDPDHQHKHSLIPTTNTNVVVDPDHKHKRSRQSQPQTQTQPVLNPNP